MQITFHDNVKSWSKAWPLYNTAGNATYVRFVVTNFNLLRAILSLLTSVSTVFQFVILSVSWRLWRLCQQACQGVESTKASLQGAAGQRRGPLWARLDPGSSPASAGSSSADLRPSRRPRASFAASAVPRRRPGLSTAPAAPQRAAGLVRVASPVRGRPPEWREGKLWSERSRWSRQF